MVNSRYKIIDVIGKGGSSFVYLVKDVRVGKRWALKELPRSDGMSIVLAKREVNMLRNIDYKMFPRITDTFVSGNYIYIISDYVEGVSLDKVIASKKISRELALSWIKNIAGALEYLHGLSPPVLYLDLKPDNVLVMPNGDIRMIDFGIAWHITGSYLPLGTPGYAAPEQYEPDGKSISTKTDIFALGMLYYTLRTGRQPDKDLTRTRELIRGSTVLTSQEKSFILKCTQEESYKRYSCIQNVSNRINQISKSNYNPGRIITYIVILAVMLLCAYVGIMRYQKKNNMDDAAREMVDCAAKYTSDGEYTLEGLKVITAFIDGDCLTDETESRFTYEVAMNYFRIQHDYSKAHRYFSKLNQEEYPEAEYLMKICELQMEFEYDSDTVLRCVGELYEDVLRRQKDEQRYEMFLLVAECYEQYTSDKTDGIKKAITVLESGINELHSESVSSVTDLEWEKEKVETVYMDKLEQLYTKAKYRHNSEKIKEET